MDTPDRAMAARHRSPRRGLRHPLDKLDGTAGQVMVAESGGMRLGGARGRARAAVPEARRMGVRVPRLPFILLQAASLWRDCVRVDTRRTRFPAPSMRACGAPHLQENKLWAVARRPRAPSGVRRELFHLDRKEGLCTKKRTAPRRRQDPVARPRPAADARQSTSALRADSPARRRPGPTGDLISMEGAGSAAQ